MKSLALSLIPVAGCLLHPAAHAQSAAPQGKPNVLFIAVDDLRPTLGCYGDTLAKTPNIDRLAAAGTTFLRAYCQQAVCSPSRVSLMTGQRPDTTRIYDLRTHFRTTIPNALTVSQYFKQNGYHAQSMGKIFHPGLDDKPSWNVPSFMPQTATYGAEGVAIEKRHLEAALAEGKRPGQAARGPAWEGTADVLDNHFRDGAVADHAVKTLRELKQTPAKPFFLAVGFAKPHLPFVAPKKYWDLYQHSDFKLPPNYRTPPADVPPVAMTGWGELRAYDGIPKEGPVTDEQALNLIHGYYASTSYMDAQLGRVLDELDRLKLRDNTVIVLWSDHGYQLGDHSMWNKHTNFEIATRVPLIFSVPGRKAGVKVRQLAELVDVYPTLCDAAGLPIPAGLAGQSLLPVLNNPQAPTKPAAWSQYPRGRGDSTMGYSMRTDRYRYTEWIERATDKTVATELYDHQTDPNENANIAARPENKALIAQLSRELQSGRAAQKMASKDIH